MRAPISVAVLVLVWGGCASAPDAETSSANVISPPPAPEKVNWEEVDKSTARMKERKNQKPSGNVTVTDEVERGFFPMSDSEYALALANAAEEVRKANPKMSESEVELQAERRADEAKWKYEHSYTTRASTTVKWSSSPPPPVPREQP